MMKQVLFAILIGLIFACGQPEPSQQKPTKPLTMDDEGYTGKYEKRYDNGRLRIQGNMVNGKREGLWKYFYDNGMLWSKGYYQDDLQHGMSSVYFRSGILRMQGEYANGENIGVWSFWNEEGELIKKVDVEKEGFPELE